LAKLITGLETVDGGEVRLLGHEVGHVPIAHRPRDAVRGAQMVFQNPEATLTPTRKVGAQIARAVKKLGPAADRGAITARTDELMREVHLPLELKKRYPAELSGGEKQRIAIARARAGEPALLVADEPVSALDVTVQKTVLDVIDASGREHGTGVLLISHDLAVVRSMADRIVVMFGGMVMEDGTTAQIFDPPYHPYTLELLAAAIGETGPRPDAARSVPEAGCPYFARCYAAIAGTCDTAPPPRQSGAPGHSVACHLPIELLDADEEEED
jgi:peptide/nickel transport system ATP-binding protein